MHKRNNLGITIAGICAGAINGLFGAGGGLVLVPLLTKITDLNDNHIFPTSISIILPICLVSLCIALRTEPVQWNTVSPYLFGSAIGGVLAGLFSSRIPTKWLHRILGCLIIWGGIRYIC